MAELDLILVLGAGLLLATGAFNSITSTADGGLLAGIALLIIIWGG